LAKKSVENPNIKMLLGDVFSKVEDDKIKKYRSKWRENPIKHIIEKFPIHLDVESTSICNLKCKFCAGTYEKYSYGFIPLELYKRIVDEGSDKGLYSIKLNFRGEPLLHPQIDTLVAYAKKKGIIDVFFNTNATLLTGDICKKLIDSGLDRLIISFEGVSKSTYETTRVGASFEKVVDNVRRFYGLREKLNSIRPLIRLQTVDIKQAKDYLQSYKIFWEKYADEITCIDQRDEICDYSQMRSDTWECPYPWRRLCITWDGNVLTCPFVTKSENKYIRQELGTLKEESIEHIWLGQAMQNIRENHLNKTSYKIEPCKYCSFRGAEILKLRENK